MEDIDEKVEEKVDRILKTAAEIIEERGWIQGRAEDEKGSVCMSRALDLAQDRIIPCDCGLMEDRMPACTAYNFAEPVRVKLRRFLSGAGVTRQGSVVGWNDAPGRTKEEVIGLLWKGVQR